MVQPPLGSPQSPSDRIEVHSYGRYKAPLPKEMRADYKDVIWRKTFDVKSGKLLFVNWDNQAAKRFQRVSEHDTHLKTIYGLERHYDRMLIEYCCGPDSLLGQSTHSSSGCEVVRLTERIDMTTESGLRFALDAVRPAPRGRILLWSSIPCTGGSTWQYINQIRNLKNRNANRISNWVDHWTLYKRLWANFLVLADAVRKAGGIIAIEWPKDCMYWDLDEVIQFVDNINGYSSLLDGCAYGLKSSSGMPMKKPWMVKTNSRILADGLR